MTIYLLDTNVFVEAKKNFYGFDICPAYWEWLIVQNQGGKFFSIWKVKEEIEKIEDDLKKWCAGKKTLFLVSDAQVESEYRNIAARVNNDAQLKPQNKSHFLSGADPWLIAHAKAHNYTVVTFERYDQFTTRKTKIPNVCKDLQVEWTDPFSMLREEKARFVLAK